MEVSRPAARRSIETQRGGCRTRRLAAVAARSGGGVADRDYHGWSIHSRGTLAFGPVAHGAWASPCALRSLRRNTVRPAMKETRSAIGPLARKVDKIKASSEVSSKNATTDMRTCVRVRGDRPHNIYDVARTLQLQSSGSLSHRCKLHDSRSCSCPAFLVHWSWDAHSRLQL